MNGCNNMKKFDLNNIFNKKTKSLIESKIRLSEESADAQLDSVLLQYQNESSEQEANMQEYLMPDYFKLYLNEAEEEDQNADEAPMDMMVGADQMQSSKPSDPRGQKINIDLYAQKVANLYQNYVNLLDIEKVIIKRAHNLLLQGYPQPIADELIEILEREFGITLENDEQNDIPMPPAGGSTGPLGI